MDEHVLKNARRFTGFAGLYDGVRPRMPVYPVEVIRQYLGRKPDRVVDLGCGTGLSTLVWRNRCLEVIGIEPSDDMLAVAQKKEMNGIAFRKGSSTSTGLPDKSADAVICSQSFHWMEPRSALSEINRVLSPIGGSKRNIRNCSTRFSKSKKRKNLLNRHLFGGKKPDICIISKAADISDMSGKSFFPAGKNAMPKD